MDHICLSPRLQMVADFVPPCACAADIGTDHGYLPIWLLQNGVIRSAIAADIHAGPLANARQSAAAYDLEERFRFVLADGLRFPDTQAADVVTIAGMGGETICAILAAAPWLRQGKQLVLQPQSKVPELTDSSGATVSRSRTQPCAATPGSAISPCVCLGRRRRSHIRWSSCCFGAVTPCCRST